MFHSCLLYNKKGEYPMKKVYSLFLALILTLGAIIPSVVNAEEVFTPYDSYSILDFESEDPDSSTWSGTVDMRFVKNDPILTAHSGVGALYVNSDGGKFSVWGGPTGSTGNSPKGGDKVAGYFYFKRISKKEGEDWKLPRVRIYPEGGDNSEDTWLAVTKDIESTSIYDAAPELGEWVRVELESTGKVVPEGATLGYNITCDGTGQEFMIDDVVFGSVTETGDTETPTEMPSDMPTETPSDAPDTTSEPVPPEQDTVVVPVTDEYIGSVMNGDFEVGDDRVGNQYWGTWTTDGAEGLTLITDPSSTPAKTAVSGTKIIRVNPNLKSAWNLFAFAQSDTDTLPRYGDRAGGSFWLYVPENADLTKNIPYVTFGYQSDPDTDIATSAGYDRTKLVKGQWNEIPIMPMAGASIQDDSKQAAIFIKAENIDTNVNYYIDNIRVGKLNEGMFFMNTTSLTKPIEDNDETADAKIIIQNSERDTDTDAVVYVAAYDNGVLAGIGLKNITIPARGETGLSITETSVEGININGIDRNELNIKAFLFDSNQTPLASVNNLYYATKKVDTMDSNIVYIGRWRDTDGSRTSSYVRPYFKTKFTGTSFAVDFDEPTSLEVTIDGKTKWYNTVQGHVVLAENLSDNEHSIRVASLSYVDVLKIKDIYIDTNAELRKPELEDTHIEFIGDSITAWDNGYSWQVGEKLGNVEHSRIAWPGIALTDGVRYYSPTNNDGMESAYFKTGVPGVQGVTDDIADWDFEASPYTPDILVINLGTNDAENILWMIPDGQQGFADTYGRFIDNLRAKLPDAEIFVLEPVSIPHPNELNPPVEKMVSEKIAAGDQKLHYIDTSDWNVPLNTDNIHPNDAGHTEMTNKLCEILAPYVD